MENTNCFHRDENVLIRTRAAGEGLRVHWMQKTVLSR